jgi:putative ABC transport system substrate-binding protein
VIGSNVAEERHRGQGAGFGISSVRVVFETSRETLGPPSQHGNRARINTLALSARLPTVYAYREFVEAGSLMSYGPNFTDLHRRAAEIVDKILRGTKPGDIPVEQPVKYDFAINLTTAKALGLTIPEAILLRVDEVIE